MASKTDVSLRNQVIYSIYVRNHTEEGTFLSIIPDLDRIRNLGTDIIWLMPIHLIGVEKKKGSLGCPYAIQNYRDVNPCYGTKEDFKKLVDEIHERGMKCIIDVVYNHTSPDSVLVKHNPEYFYKNENGEFGNMAGDWGDVIDLDYNNKDLWRYQIDTLKMWAEIVDGFRCDVASKVPVEFWMKARQEVDEIRPDCIWLAESVHPGFVKYLRDNGMIGHTDSEMYEAFDICYGYDVREDFEAYLEGKTPLSSLIKMLNFQDCIYPNNYVKLRCVENHDTPRICSYVQDVHIIKNYTAFMYFEKGTPLIYAGQEMLNDKCPSLFEYDKVDWNTGKDISELMSKLYQIKKNEIFANGAYNLKAYDEFDTVIGTYEKDEDKLIGIFTFAKQDGFMDTDIEDGVYTNLITGDEVMVEEGRIDLEFAPIIMRK